MSVLLVLLAILAWIVLAAVGLALLVLAMPLELAARGAVRDGEPEGSVEAVWAFGLVAVAVTPAGLAVRVAGVPAWRAGWRRLRRGGRGERAERRRRRAPRAAKGEQKAGGGQARALLDRRRTFARMLARFARALHLRLRLAGTVGLRDPADTAALASALQLLRQVPGVELDVEVDWLDESLEGEAVGSARVWVPELLAAAVALLLERENRAALWSLAR